ncbi:hypothetical protein, conserved [Eimeria brunetti]|uniref:Uncharacterized protein n=1 Tax=Eimeria brunetti TaxID=51314 RepID=U6LBG3_9EIME|nr:hypothetical protein, conserved [Eimeria brunetti]
MDPNSLDLLSTHCKETLQKLLRPQYLVLIPKWMAEASPAALRAVSFLGSILEAPNFHVFQTITPSVNEAERAAAEGGAAAAEFRQLEEWQSFETNIGKKWKVAETLGE